MSEIRIDGLLAGDISGEQPFSDLSFKEGMLLLDEIVKKLETGDLELEESLKVYSLGVSLLTDLQSRLNSAEQEVEVLMGKLDQAPEDDVQDTTLLNA